MIQRRAMTAEQMRERSEMCRRERQNLLRYAIWNSRRIREEKEEKAKQENEKETRQAAPNSPSKQASSPAISPTKQANSPPKQADADSPKRLVLRPLNNASAGSSLLAGASAGTNMAPDGGDDATSESSDSTADSDSDDLEDLLASFQKLERAEYRSLLTKSYSSRSSQTEVVEDGSSEDSDDSWSDCDSDDDVCSCCVISGRRGSGSSNKDLTACFQTMSKRFNAMVTSVNQTKL